jgi:hypothetical protein
MTGDGCKTGKLAGQLWGPQSTNNPGIPEHHEFYAITSGAYFPKRVDLFRGQSSVSNGHEKPAPDMQVRTYIKLLIFAKGGFNVAMAAIKFQFSAQR